MILELKPEQERILEQAAQAGVSQQEVLDQAFALIREQYQSQDWMLGQRAEVSARIADGFAQAERGELMDVGQAKRLLTERRRKRRIA